MKKAAQKTAAAKTKTTVQAKKPSAGKPAQKAKALPKQAKSVAKKTPAQSKTTAKKVLPTKTSAAAPQKKLPRKVKTAVNVKLSARQAVSTAVPEAVALPPAPKLPSSGAGTRDNPWVLKTPPGGAEFQAFRDETLNPPALVVRVGSTELRYHLRCVTDLHEMLKAYGDWMLLGAADEQKPVIEGTVEAWARSPANPVGGWYGLKNGLRGRFGVYVPPVLEVLGLAEVEHFPRDNRMRAKSQG
jgi:hypothetical protein